ncbi:MAG: 2-oxoacid:acceptor oxidoreductase family protein [Candidatus Eiseniibacteriota bacterium]|nr:MAG: 2-oxoacid:acceptor oxidoreductase family protein [Candidatus Eisenbacteria bacterium]
MARQFLTSKDVPFCKGCSHAGIALNTEAALQKLGVEPLDVVIVTDIGCHGIIDKFLTTHTVHGLHGRSIAIAAGIRMGLADPEKKVIVFVGDGGATIGLKHIIAAAHRNIDMTVVVHNNMLYGMTGGQPSDLTPAGFRTPTMAEGDTGIGFDLCGLVKSAGAAYVSRIVGSGDFSGQLAEAFRMPGFSLVEIVEICPSYGVRENPGVKLSNIAEKMGLTPMESIRPDAKSFRVRRKEAPVSLLDGLDVLSSSSRSALDRKFRIVLGGSAGEGVQVATRLFAEAAVRCGLHVTTKGNYPVTVGVGYSCSEIILSPERILSTVVRSPDALVVVSPDGMEFCRRYLEQLEGEFYLDESISVGEAARTAPRAKPFRKRAGPRRAALFALMVLLADSDVFPLEEYAEVIRHSKLGEGVAVDDLVGGARELASGRGK